LWWWSWLNDVARVTPKQALLILPLFRLFEQVASPSTGYTITTDLEVEVFTLQDGEFEMTFPTWKAPAWSGKYVRSTSTDMTAGQYMYDHEQQEDYVM
jgi:hypothetical protein